AANPADFGIDPDRIALAGDSAGGNLAAVCALMAKQRGGPALAFQLLIYPVVDYGMENGAYQDHADTLVLNRDRMAYFWDLYVPDPAQRTDWRAAPLLAPDHAGLPPALILGSGIDPLYAEGVAYAEKLKAAGVAVEHVGFPRMTHAFFQAPALLDDSREAVDRAGAALKNAFAG
ncbi:MAG: alpha/beta hydrolase, partial [Alphaproteobacteria bacterium]